MGRFLKRFVGVVALVCKRLTERHTQGVARSPLKRLNNGFARLFAAALAFAVL